MASSTQVYELQESFMERETLCSLDTSCKLVRKQYENTQIIVDILYTRLCPKDMRESAVLRKGEDMSRIIGLSSKESFDLK